MAGGTRMWLCGAYIQGRQRGRCGRGERSDSLPSTPSARFSVSAVTEARRPPAPASSTPRRSQRGRAARSGRPTPSLTPILFLCTGDGVGVGSDSLDGETLRTREAIEDFSCPYLFIVLRGLGFVACVRVRWRRRRGGGDAPARGR